MKDIQVRPLYLGQPRGFYQRDRFDKFVRKNIVRELGELCELTVEGEMPEINYRFQNADMCLTYHKYDKTRVIVGLIGNSRGKINIDKVEKLILEKDK